jgi:hypothetical protein
MCQGERTERGESGTLDELASRQEHDGQG